MNRFFKKDDIKIDKLIFDLEPNFWWSRLYEYPFALNFVEKEDIILDCCCGTYHPFKFKLVDICNEVHALDLESPKHKEELISMVDKYFKLNSHKLLTTSQLENINYIKCDIQTMPYINNKFDKIFCISALEHMPLEVVKNGLKEMKRVLKDSGKIILTVDYPALTPEQLIEMVYEIGLKIDGEYDYSIPNNAIESIYFGGKLNCYNMVLSK